MKTVILLATALSLHAAEGPSLKLIAEVKGFASPESVATDGRHYFISNVGKELKPTDQDGDGFISRMDPKGENLELRFIDGLNAPKGLLVQGDTLYACDVDVLLGFELATGRKTLEISFAKDGVKFLNDVCAAPHGRLIVSATDQNKLYLVDPIEKSFAAIQLDTAPQGPNGLAFITAGKDAYLLVAEWGTDDKPNGSILGYALDSAMLKGTLEDPGNDFPVKDGYLDGVAILTKDGRPTGVLYSDWVDFKPGGKLLMMAGEDGPVVTDLAIPGGPVAGPADFLYDPRTATIVLPCMIEGRVLLMKLTVPEMVKP